MTTDERLIEAISDKTSLDIIYNGGSQPGTVRRITPTIVKDGKVRAYCHTSKNIKSFLVEKISIVDAQDQQGSESWKLKIRPSQLYATIGDFIEEQQEALTKQGWNIESSEKHLSLHRTGKRGKPLKNYDVILTFEELTHDLIMDIDGIYHKENVRKKQRPWTVRAEGKETRTYGSLGTAAELFMAWAKLYAPITEVPQ